jgi:hypothetical protein
MDLPDFPTIAAWSNCSSGSQPFGSRCVRATPFIEPEQALGFSRNSDPYALAYFPRRPDGVAKPQGAGGEQVHAVMLRANTHGLSESPRTSGKVVQGRLGAAKVHEMDSIERLKSAQQDASPRPANFARDVHQKV